jgi:hypothetical protein
MRRKHQEDQEEVADLSVPCMHAGDSQRVELDGSGRMPDIGADELDAIDAPETN